MGGANGNADGGSGVVLFPKRDFPGCRSFVNAVALNCSAEFPSEEMPMKKIAMILMMAGLLAGGACSRPKEEAAKSKATPDPKLATRMEKQQSAINRASEELKKEEEKAKTNQSATPSVSPP